MSYKVKEDMRAANFAAKQASEELKQHYSSVRGDPRRDIINRNITSMKTQSPWYKFYLTCFLCQSSHLQCRKRRERFVAQMFSRVESELHHFEIAHKGRQSVHQSTSQKGTTTKNHNVEQQRRMVSTCFQL